MFNITNRAARAQYLAKRNRMMLLLERSQANKIRPILGRQYIDAAKLLTQGVREVDAAVDEQKDRMMSVFSKHYRRTASIFGKDVYDELKKQKGLMIPTETKTMQDEFWSALKIWISKETAKKVVMVSDTTKLNLKSIIDRGFSDGKSYREIAKDILAKKEITNPVRAMKIARTETHSASNKSTDEAVASTRVKFEREWTAAHDERVRTDHLAADDQRRDQETPFEVGGELLMFPGDWSMGASAGNTINCRCGVLYHSIEVIETEKPAQTFVSEQEVYNLSLDREWREFDSVKERDKYMKEQSNKWNEKLTDYEKRVSSYYQGSGFDPVNTYLRSGKVQSGKTKKDLVNYVKNLTDSIDKSIGLDKDITVFRGASKNFILNAKKGTIIQDKSFISTSLNKQIAENFAKDYKGVFCEIHVPKGMKTGFFSGEESEVLLQRGTNFRVVDIQLGKTKKYILEAVM